MSSCVTGLLNSLARLRSDRFQLNVEVTDCRTASVPVTALDGLDKSRRCKSDSHLTRDVSLLSDERSVDLGEIRSAGGPQCFDKIRGN